MWKWLGNRLSFANVVSVIALFVALGGSAYAIGPITTVSTSAQVARNSLGSVYIQCPDGSVVLSGGGAGSVSGVSTVLSRKSDPNGWRYDALNNTPATEDITVFAYCLGA